MSRLPPRARLLLLAGAFWLPFLGRPLFVDDHAHFHEALALADHLPRPYNPAGLGWTRGQTPTEANPPLYFYLVAAWTDAAGVAPWKTKALFLALQALGLLGFYSLALRWTRHPLWASALWLATPHFWLTANSLLLDGLIVPAMVGGLALWIDGWERGRWTRLVAAGLCLGAAGLVKYTGMLGWAVAGLWTLWGVRGRPPRRAAALLIPLVLWAGWFAWTHSLYGESHLGATARGSWTAPSLWGAAAVLVFTAGTTPLWGLLPFAARGRTRLAALLAWGGATAFGALAGGPTPAIGLAWGFLLGAALAGAAAFRGADRVTRFLLVWAGAGLAGLTAARGWVCARYLVIVGPALVLAAVRALESRPWTASPARRAAAFGALALFGGLLAHADARQAAVDGQAARDLEAWRAAHAPETRGHYPAAILSSLGDALPKDRWSGLERGAPLPEGAVLALPARGLPPAFFPAVRAPRFEAAFHYRSLNPLRTQDPPTGAGFYGSAWGALPFSLSTAPLETYWVVRNGPEAADRAAAAPRDSAKK